VIARRCSQRDEVAGPAQPRIRGDGLAQQRSGETGRDRVAELQNLARRLVRRDRPAAILDQLDEPVGGIETQLHPREATTNIRSRPPSMLQGWRAGAEGPQGRVRGQLRERPDPPLPLRPARLRTLARPTLPGTGLPSQCVGRTSSTQDTVSSHRTEPPSVRGAGAPGDGTAVPFSPLGPPSRSPRALEKRRPSRRPLPWLRRRRAATIRRDPSKPDRGPLCREGPR